MFFAIEKAFPLQCPPGAQSWPSPCLTLTAGPRLRDTQKLKPILWAEQPG
jgi:hypothetical protein